MQECISWQPTDGLCQPNSRSRIHLGSKLGTYESGTEDDESSLAGAAVGRVNNPLARLPVEAGSCYNGVEGTVFLDIHDLVNMVKISSNLLVIWVVCRPVPRVVHIGPGELILRHG